MKPQARTEGANDSNRSAHRHSRFRLRCLRRAALSAHGRNRDRSSDMTTAIAYGLAVLICVLVGCYIAEKYDDRNPPLP